MDTKLTDIGNNFNEKLVELVGKHKILYDTKTEGYSNFQLQDEIWRKIAGELNEDVAACKLKWKNIRSCYTRYLRQISSQNCKITRTYYLAKHLRFLLPFCKPNIRQVGEISSPSSDENPFLHCDEQELEPVYKTEPQDESEPTVHFDEDNEELNTNSKRHVWDTNNECDCYNKKCKISDSGDEAELNFFKSLLPDLRKMTGKQKNQLKITILSAVDSILYTSN